MERSNFKGCRLRIDKHITVGPDNKKYIRLISIDLPGDKFSFLIQQGRKEKEFDIRRARHMAAQALAEDIVGDLTYQAIRQDRTETIEHGFSIYNCTTDERKMAELSINALNNTIDKLAIQLNKEKILNAKLLSIHKLSIFKRVWLAITNKDVE